MEYPSFEGMEMFHATILVLKVEEPLSLPGLGQ